MNDDPNRHIEKAQSYRLSGAVFKSKLINFRSRFPAKPVFVFEGQDDKVVYKNWINKLRPDMSYEPFPCQGKKNVLWLRDSVLRDVNDLARSILFFVDRDFDDLQGRAAHLNTFVTDYYSVENYMVSRDVLDSLLANEFNCHSEPELRNTICEMF